MSEMLLYGADGGPMVGVNGDRYPDLPLGTYFANAGLSRAEAVSASAECLRRAKSMLQQHLRDLEIREPGAARRYTDDTPQAAAKRHELNQQVVAAAMLSMGFDHHELREIDAGLGLGLASKTTDPQIAHCYLPDGSEEQFEILDDPREEHGCVLHSLRTGIDWH